MEDVKKQIVASIREHSNILVTVSTDPSVDELSAALGLTLVLDVLDKRATAVVSGMIPPAIKFLDPDKTFDTTADSLRDFIIALDKDKADHLRYKVEGDVVKIFITPYKTTLTQDDLEFSQGDYNVDLVLAIGVKDQDHLDKALAAHGKILHDATLVTVSAGPEKSTLGSIDWHESTASSVSEMVTSLVDLLKEDKPLLSEQIATALLTGIVAATDRFSNNRTTSQVMTMAAQLMAAGANQQLIAAKLEEAHEIGMGTVAGNPQAKRDKDEPEEQPANTDPTELTITRNDSASGASLPIEKDAASQPLQAVDDSPAEDTLSQREFEKQLSSIPGAAAPIAAAGETLESIEQELKDAQKEEEAPAPSETDNQPLTAASDASMPGFEPTPPPAPVTPLAPETPAATVPVFTAPAETPQIITNHGATVNDTPPQLPVINGTIDAPHEGEAPTVDPFSSAPAIEKVEVPPLQPVMSEPAPALAMNLGTPEGAALLAASDSEPSLPPLSAPAPTVEPQAVPAPVAAIPALPPLPPLPTDVNVPLPPPPPLPPLNQPSTVMPSGAVSGDIFNDGSSTPSSTVTPAPASPPEPGQFRIPGQ